MHEQTKLAFKWDPTYYQKAGLPRGGPFGCISGNLIFGTKHHLQIMAALIKKGWTWAQVTSAHQAWGWFGIIEPSELMNDYPDEWEWESYTYQGIEDRNHPAKKWPFLRLTFASDAGTQDPIGYTQCIQAFQNLYKLPVQKGETYDFEHVEGVSEDEYGKGLGGDINDYFNPDHYLYNKTDEVQNVPDPPAYDPWTDKHQQRLDLLQKKQKQYTDLYGSGTLLPEKDQQELMELWMKKMEQGQAVTAKTAGPQYKWVWGDGIFEVTKGFLKTVHHQSMLQNLVNKLGRIPQNYIAGDYTQDPFHPQFGTVTVVWHQGSGLPSPDEIKQMMQEYLGDRVGKTRSDLWSDVLGQVGGIDSTLNKS